MEASASNDGRLSMRATVTRLPGSGWVSGYDSLGKIAVGEVGLLKRVSRLGSGVFLVIDLDGHEYYGGLEWDEPPAFTAVENLLREYIGGSIRAIGELQIP